MSLCPVGVMMQHNSESAAEVISMILDDREGYSDEFAAKALFGYGDIAAEGVDVHRRGKCDCPPTRSEA